MPASFEGPGYVRLVSTFIAVTPALGMIAPVGSVTDPVMEPVIVWENAGNVRQASRDVIPATLYNFIRPSFSKQRLDRTISVPCVTCQVSLMAVYPCIMSRLTLLALATFSLAWSAGWEVQAEKIEGGFSGAEGP